MALNSQTTSGTTTFTKTFSLPSSKASQWGSGFAYSLWKDNYLDSRFDQNGVEKTFSSYTTNQKLTLIDLYLNEVMKTKAIHGDRLNQQDQLAITEFNPEVT